ncbi:hypothetical protein ONZ45_g11958 [Pleurotus djamor]|nr:hypothetical protein ONZ45_g11958 [Pleurotus djamor]
MSITATSLADSLSATVPKLDIKGRNWPIFAERFEVAVDAKGYWGHFDGSELRPEVPGATRARPTRVAAAGVADATGADVPVDATGTTPWESVAGSPAQGAAPVLPEVDPLDAEAAAAAVVRWDKDEKAAKQLLNQKIPDSTLMLIRQYPTVRERWAAIVKEYTKKGEFAKTEMRASFLGMKCGDKGDVREFLEGLRMKREELAMMGVIISDDDYRSTILQSLPTGISNFTSNQLAMAKLLGHQVDPDALISLISEESDRWSSHRSRRAKKSRDDDGIADEAMAVSSNQFGGRGKGRPPKGRCHHCKEFGHWKRECPKLAQGNKSNNSPQGGTANAAEESDSEAEGAFSAEDPSGDLPELLEVSDSEEESDGDSGKEEFWFSEEEEEGYVGVAEREAQDFGSREGDGNSSARDGNSNDQECAAFAVWDSVNKNPGDRAEVLDSGSSKHISPYLEDFTSFREIPPRKLKAANKGPWTMVEKACPALSFPCPVEISRLRRVPVRFLAGLWPAPSHMTSKSARHVRSPWTSGTAGQAPKRLKNVRNRITGL